MLRTQHNRKPYLLFKKTSYIVNTSRMQTLPTVKRLDRLMPSFIAQTSFFLFINGNGIM